MEFSSFIIYFDLFLWHFTFQNFIIYPKLFLWQLRIAMGLDGSGWPPQCLIFFLTNETVISTLRKRKELQTTSQLVIQTIKPMSKKQLGRLATSDKSKQVPSLKLSLAIIFAKAVEDLEFQVRVLSSRSKWSFTLSIKYLAVHFSRSPGDRIWFTTKDAYEDHSISHQFESLAHFEAQSIASASASWQHYKLQYLTLASWSSLHHP